MHRRTRNRSFPDVVVERETDSEVSSSEDDDDEQTEASGHETIRDDAEKKYEKKSITISLKKVCKVCKRAGHEAGFRGATYIDCPMKPCFLCKKAGHTTLTCPHRVATEHGVVPAPHRSKRKQMDYIFGRQLSTRASSSISRLKPAFEVPDELRSAVIRYHSRRVTCLEFHPTNDGILVSGDKKGQLGVWDYHKVYEKIVYANVHTCILNNIRFDPRNSGLIYTASSDGTLSYTDMETGIPLSSINLNPNGWQGVGAWKMLYGMDVALQRGLVLVADNFGFLHTSDLRCSRSSIGQPVLIHKSGTKVVGLHCNPLHADILLSCGNDHFARIWDMRRLIAGDSICSLPHDRVVNSAYFSPISGTKILTTSQDNRLRVWDYIFGNLQSPSREIVHSHDFNRHLTPFRAEFDPKDPTETLVVIGRYISENYSGTALHPIDFIDIATGLLVAEVVDPNITTITPVNKLHPRDDVLASGSSRSIFIWRPKEEDELTHNKQEKKIVVCAKLGKRLHRKFARDSDDSDDDKFGRKEKNMKSQRFPTDGKRGSTKKDKIM